MKIQVSSQIIFFNWGWVKRVSELPYMMLFLTTLYPVYSHKVVWFHSKLSLFLTFTLWREPHLKATSSLWFPSTDDHWPHQGTGVLNSLKKKKPSPASCKPGSPNTDFSNHSLNPDTFLIYQNVLLYWITLTTLGFISSEAVLQETASSLYLTYNSEPTFKLQQHPIRRGLRQDVSFKSSSRADGHSSRLPVFHRCPELQ